MLVQDVMDRNHPTIHTDELATKARALLRESKLRILPVVDEHERLVGVVYRSDLMNISSSVSPIRVNGIMSVNPYAVSPDKDIIEVLRTMTSSDQWYVPVIRSEQDLTYVGVFGLEHFIRISLQRDEARLSKALSGIMSTKLLTCSRDDEIDDVWQRMKQRSFAACPVVKKGKPVGIISQQDLLESGAFFPKFEDRKGHFRSPTRISFLMKTPVASLKMTDTIKDAATVMLERNIGRVPIVDDKGILVGIVDREDIVKTLIK